MNKEELTQVVTDAYEAQEETINKLRTIASLDQLDLLESLQEVNDAVTKLLRVTIRYL